MSHEMIYRVFEARLNGMLAHIPPSSLTRDYVFRMVGGAAGFDEESFRYCWERRFGVWVDPAAISWSGWYLLPASSCQMFVEEIHAMTSTILPVFLQDVERQFGSEAVVIVHLNTGRNGLWVDYFTVPMKNRPWGLVHTQSLGVWTLEEGAHDPDELRFRVPLHTPGSLPFLRALTYLHFYPKSGPEKESAAILTWLWVQGTTCARPCALSANLVLVCQFQI